MACFTDIRNKTTVLSLLLTLSDHLGAVDAEIGSLDAHSDRIFAWLGRQAIDHTVDIQPLLDDLNISERHANRLCTQATGRTIRQEHMRLRLQRADALLTRGGTSIKEVASAIGFTDAQHFSRVFKKQFGRTPSASKPSH